MLNTQGVEEYWKEQTEKGDNPCHYHNKWQDLYAFRMRTRAFKKSDFVGMSQIVDIGCGIGEYTMEIAKLTTAHIDAFDFPFNIKIAKERYGNNLQITFHPFSIPHQSISEAIEKADGVVTTTVYVHFSPEVRATFYSYVNRMKKGSRVMLLEYVPHSIPVFQKKLTYKKVETIEEITEKFNASGFVQKEIKHVNFIDGFLFFYFGKNAVSYHLTRMLERILCFIGYTKSKYKLLVFEKI